MSEIHIEQLRVRQMKPAWRDYRLLTTIRETPGTSAQVNAMEELLARWIVPPVTPDDMDALGVDGVFRLLEMVVTAIEAGIAKR